MGSLGSVCGIVGYVGERPALEVVMQGLRRLEYRGYDSAGVAVLDGESLDVERRAGKLANLDEALADRQMPGRLGIGHTRWATHGAPTDRNAHPHLDGASVAGATYHVDWDTAAAEKAGYDYFMLKEIDEQPEAVQETIGGRLGPDGRLRLDELAISDEDIRGFHQVVIVACGSSYHSGLIGKYAIERWTRIPTQVEIASEFRYRDPVVDRDTLVIAISQSGETADTLEALRHARQQGAWAMAVTNTVGSSVARDSDAAFYTRGGPEIAVASTKPVMAQYVAKYLVGLNLAQVRGTRDGDEVRSHYQDLATTPALIQTTLSRMDTV